MASRQCAEWLRAENRRCEKRLDVHDEHRFCPEHRSVEGQRAVPLSSAPYGTVSVPVRRPPPVEPRPAEPTAPVLTDEVYEVTLRTCTERWQKAVTWRLANALDESLWLSVRRRPPGLCARLAVAAVEIEETAGETGDVVGIPAVDGWRRLGMPRLVQRVSQALVGQSVPLVGETVADAVVRGLRVVGVWACTSTGRYLGTCGCLVDLSAGRSPRWVADRLARELSGVRPAPRTGRR